MSTSELCCAVTVSKWIANAPSPIVAGLQIRKHNSPPHISSQERITCKVLRLRTLNSKHMHSNSCSCLDQPPPKKALPGGALPRTALASMTTYPKTQLTKQDQGNAKPWMRPMTALALHHKFDKRHQVRSLELFCHSAEVRMLVRQMHIVKTHSPTRRVLMTALFR